MKANELRIGNYLNTVNGVKRVSDISVDRYCWFTDNQCEPIPLIEEWLLKFGFVNQNYGWNIKDFGLFDHNYKKGELNLKLNASEVPIIEIKHVHQLQNLYFALTGEELEIK